MDRTHLLFPNFKIIELLHLYDSGKPIAIRAGGRTDDGV